MTISHTDRRYDNTRTTVRPSPVLKLEVSYRGIIVGVLARRRAVGARAALAGRPARHHGVHLHGGAAAVCRLARAAAACRARRRCCCCSSSSSASSRGLFALVVPAMIDEFQSIRDNLPEDAREMEEFLDNFGIDVELQQRARDIDWTDLISGRAAIDYGQRIFQTTLSILTIIVDHGLPAGRHAAALALRLPVRPGRARGGRAAHPRVARAASSAGTSAGR